MTKPTPSYRRSVARLSPDDYLDPTTYRQSRSPVELATTLIPDAYTSEAFYDLELERVFATSWVYVASLSDFEAEGDTVVSRVAGRSIIIVRNAAGDLNAFHNVCRHRGAQLLDDGCTGVSKMFRCPYHAWAYDLNGACLGTPLFTSSDIPEDQQGIFDMTDVEEFDRANYGLHSVRLEVWGFMVFVTLDDTTGSLAEHLGDLPDRTRGYRLDEWVVVREETYDIAANYKLVGENFMEYYHLPWVHPELVKVSKIKDHYRWQGPGMYTGMTTWPISQNTDQGGWQGVDPAPFLEGTDREAGRFIWLFPNVAINLLPNHAVLLITEPDGPGRTIETFRLLSHPDCLSSEGAEAGLDALLGFWDLVNRQDIDIVERVQHGLSNPAYSGGRMCYRFEEPLHRFQNMIIDRILGMQRIPGGDDATQTPMFVETPTRTD